MNTPVAFSQRPGRFERHFRRKLDNDLFPRPSRMDDKPALLEAQRLDHEELLAFLPSLRQLVYRAANLNANEETEVIMNLKGELEKHYELACGLADNQQANKQAIAHLLDVIMVTLQRNAVGDALAEQELADETLARTRHFKLLEQPLVADLLHPETLIQADELLPVLFTDPEPEVKAALGLFDAAQLQQLRADGERLLQQKAASQVQLMERLQWLDPLARQEEVDGSRLV